MRLESHHMRSKAFDVAVLHWQALLTTNSLAPEWCKYWERAESRAAYVIFSTKEVYIPLKMNLNNPHGNKRWADFDQRHLHSERVWFIEMTTETICLKLNLSRYKLKKEQTAHFYINLFCRVKSLKFQTYQILIWEQVGKHFSFQ